jgi:hypothetical protein
MVDFLNSFPAHLIYVLLFVLLFLCGIGFPMAEELVLLGGGVLVASAVLRPLPMLLSTFLGTIIGDVLLFWLGRGLATRLTTSMYLTRWLPLHQIAKGRAFFCTLWPHDRLSRPLYSWSACPDLFSGGHHANAVLAFHDHGFPGGTHLCAPDLLVGIPVRRSFRGADLLVPQRAAHHSDRTGTAGAQLVAVALSRQAGGP